MMKTSPILVLALSFSMIAPSIGQSISEKLAQEVPKPPRYICIEDQCNYIIYSNDGDKLLAAWTELHGKKFYGWGPLCLSCSMEEQYNAGAKALVNEVKAQFPEAGTGLRELKSQCQTFDCYSIYF